MASKRQTTMAKLARERRVQEKREQKAERKQAAKEAREAHAAEGGAPDAGGEHWTETVRPSETDD